ncbi:MAG TPA: hypothetical protein VFJ70_04845 [Burkholderiales bacterium]|nr:hypothetical protein [Burkholderiales bacterium]
MLNFDVEPRVGYLYVTATGRLEIADAERALAEMFSIAARAHQPRMLLDCSRLAAEWGSDERYTVGSFIAAEMERRASQFPQRPRLAIYAVAPLMDPNRYTQTVATNRGALVRSSDSLQELLSWLGV